MEPDNRRIMTEIKRNRTLLIVIACPVGWYYFSSVTESQSTIISFELSSINNIKLACCFHRK